MPERIGPYRLERTLGRGGMGVVYAAWDERLRRRVALKQLLAEVVGDSRRRERMRREARMIARLDHAAIVRIYDLLETEEGDWIVMQYIEGPTLAERLRHGPLAPAEVVALARDVAGALAAAHEQGLLHRDLKTENVLLTPGGGAKVLDFGLAKLYLPEAPSPGAGETVGLTGGIVGTYRAMSPEQANGLELDPRADLFSLGILLYEAATAVSPFQQATPVATMTRVCTHQQPPAHEVEPAVPAALAGLIDSLLEKDPDRRPASATSFLNRLDMAVAEGVLPPAAVEASPPLRLSKAPDADPQPTIGSSISAGSVGSAGSAARTGRRLRLSLGVLVLGALAAAALLNRPGLPAREPLYVVVARPEIGAGTAAADDGPERLAAAALHAALLRSLASLDGVVALAGDLTEGNATAQRLARVHAADEVLTTSLDCAARQCLATLRRQRGADGQILHVQSFEVPADDVRLLSTAASTYLKAGYAELGPRGGTRELSVRSEDYARFLRLQRRWEEERPADLAPLLAELAEIRAGSPLFVDAYLLEARLTSHRFFETREAVDLDRSLALIDQARNLAPGDPLPLAVLFSVALGAGRMDAAGTAAEELERLVPGDAGAIHRRAVLAEAQGEGRRALELMREVAERRPAADFLMDLANLELRQGEAAAARKTLEDLLRRIPAHLGGEKLLAQVELASGSPARAAELYADLLRRRRGFAELSNFGVAQMLLRDWKGAAASLEEAYALAPRSAPAALNLADAMTLAGRLDEASTLYARVLELVAEDPAPGFWQTLSVKAQALAHLGRAPEAAAAVQQATAAAPDNPQLAYEAALVYALIGDWASAMASAGRAVSGGFDRRWFALPFFDSLRETRAWGELLAAAEARASPAPAAR
ncbi:MAG TPA: protein kinase [Thermoanaerobaculia bacterium]|nr:protein kinase [Thermoanaerobaculia bacterium]